MIKGVEHTGIIVSDMDRSLRFYQEVLGLQLRRRAPLNETVELAFLYHPNQPSMEVELICGRTMEQIEGKVNHLAFRVENLEEEIARLDSLGVELTDRVPKLILGDVKIAFFKGPDGEKLEFVER